MQYLLISDKSALRNSSLGEKKGQSISNLHLIYSSSTRRFSLEDVFQHLLSGGTSVSADGLDAFCIERGRLVDRFHLEADITLLGLEHAFGIYLQAACTMSGVLLVTAHRDSPSQT